LAAHGSTVPGGTRAWLGRSQESEVRSQNDELASQVAHTLHFMYAPAGLSTRRTKSEGHMSALTTAAHRLRPINNRAVMVGACAVLVLLSVPIAPVAKAQGLGLIDASYAADVKLSDVRLERGKGNEVHISGRVTNSGQKIVTG